MLTISIFRGNTGEYLPDRKRRKYSLSIKTMEEEPKENLKSLGLVTYKFLYVKKFRGKMVICYKIFVII